MVPITTCQVSTRGTKPATRECTAALSRSSRIHHVSVGGNFGLAPPLVVKQTGVRKKRGDDGECFARALDAARTWGGVIEHPWGSYAWPHFNINTPPREGGWIVADFYGGWTCCVEQGRYGHYARKPTLLLVYGLGIATLPELLWGKSEAKLDPAVVARMGLKRAKRIGEVGARGGGTDSSPRIGTPSPFRDLLMSMALSVVPIAANNNEALRNVA